MTDEEIEAGSATPIPRDLPHAQVDRRGGLSKRPLAPVVTLAVEADRAASRQEIAEALLDLVERLHVNVKALVDGINMTAHPGDDADSVVARHDARLAEGRRYSA